MYNQHAKWLEKAKLEIDWRCSYFISEILLITSLVWRQDHKTASRTEDPGFRRGEQQERERYAYLFAAGREHAAQRCGPLPAQSGLCQRNRSDKQADLVYLDMDGGPWLHLRRELGIGTGQH